MWSIAWWKDASERSIRATIAALIGFLGTFAPQIGINNINWNIAASVALYAALSSLALSMGTQGVTHNGPGVQANPHVDSTGRHHLE